MEDNFIDNINNLYKNNKWYDILHLNVETCNEVAHTLLWVWPSEQNLIFISNLTKKFNKNGVISIGCGSGLFEWLLNKTTGTQVTGIEIDQSWWSSKYSKNKFIDMQFVKMPPDPSVIRKDHALLFCYFNNAAAFKEYIHSYGGDLVFIIGPGKERETLTNPEPFLPNFVDPQWKLLDYQEVKNSGDYIAVWTR